MQMQYPNYRRLIEFSEHEVIPVLQTRDSMKFNIPDSFCVFSPNGIFSGLIKNSAPNRKRRLSLHSLSKVLLI